MAFIHKCVFRVSCYNFRAKRNSHGHPFSASSPIELRKAALKLYEKCLNQVRLQLIISTNFFINRLKTTYFIEFHVYFCFKK